MSAVEQDLPATPDEMLAEVVDLRARVAVLDEVVDTTAQLRDRVEGLVDRITGPAPLADVRAAMNEVRIGDARRMLEVDAIDLVSNALDTLRRAQDAERKAKDLYDEALVEAEWGFATCFVTRSNKQWLVRENGADIPEADQRSFDAAARKEWIAYHAARTEMVRDAKAVLAHAQETVAMARDDVSIAEKRFTAAKHSLDAAAAQLHAYVRCTPRDMG